MPEKRYFVVTHRVEGDCLGQVLAAIEVAASAEICELLDVVQDQRSPAPAVRAAALPVEYRDQSYGAALVETLAAEPRRQGAHPQGGPGSEPGRKLRDGLKRAPTLGRRPGVRRACHETTSGAVVLQALASAPRVYAAIGEVLEQHGLSRSSVTPTLTRLRDQGLLMKDGLKAELTLAGREVVLSEAHAHRIASILDRLTTPEKSN